MTPAARGVHSRTHNALVHDLDINDLIVFARVVESGSFSAAGRRLGVPTSTVSRRLAALELYFGERLFHRNTRKLALTDLGLNLVEQARVLSASLEDVRSLALHRQAAPSGRLRVSLPSDIGSMVLTDMLTRFVADHPGITLEVDLSPRRVDLIAENYDLAVRFGDLPDDSLLTVRKLADIPASLYASPAYLASLPPVQQPEDLLRVHALVMSTVAGEAQTWRLNHGSTGLQPTWQGLPVNQTIANAPSLLIRMAVAGAGVVGLPEILVHREVAEGRLLRVLPGWRLPPGRCSAVFPGRRLMPVRTRVFLEALVAALNDAVTDD